MSATTTAIEGPARATLLTLAASLALTFVFTGSARVDAATPDTTETSRSTFRLVPRKDRVEVRVDMAITNRKRDMVRVVPCPSDPSLRCRQRITYYFDRWALVTQTAARDVRVAGSSARANVLRRGEGWTVYEVTFDPAYAGQTRRLRATWSLPSSRPRSANPTRITEAYAHFCWHGQPTDTGTTTAILPGGYETDTYGGAVREKATRKATTIRAKRTRDPVRFFGCTDAFDPGRLLHTETVSPSGQAVVVEGWPEDPGWSTAITAGLETSLPQLESVIGVPFPRDDVIVREVASQALRGYAGDFSPRSGQIRVGERLDDPALVAHELAHAWFHGGTLAELWAIEGFADWAGRHAAGGTCEEAGPYPGKGSPAIRDWRFLGADPSERDQEVVAWQYAAACGIIEDVADAMGPERMHDVIVGLILGSPKYAPPSLFGPLPPDDDEAERPGAPDWREWLDAVDELGLVPAGVTDLELAERLVIEHGVARAKDLKGRAEARAAYHAALAGPLAEAMPQVVREHMDAWRFGKALEALALTEQAAALLEAASDAGLALDRRAELEAQLAEARTLAQVGAVLQAARSLPRAAGG